MLNVHSSGAALFEMPRAQMDKLLIEAGVYPSPEQLAARRRALYERQPLYRLGYEVRGNWPIVQVRRECDHHWGVRYEYLLAQGEMARWFCEWQIKWLEGDWETYLRVWGPRDARPYTQNCC